MLYNAEPDEPEFAAKRRTRLIIQRAAVPQPNDPSLTYFGGLPRLPSHLDWPSLPRRPEDGDGEGPVALTFIAQIHVADLPLWIGREFFPLAGTIYIFCNTQFVDVGDPGCVVLYHNGSPSGFEERLPPSNLMRIGGDYDHIQRCWLSGRDAGVDFKYPIGFEVFPKAPTVEDDWAPDWLSALGFYGHDDLSVAWPLTPTFVNTFKAALAAAFEQTKTNYGGEPWLGYSELAALAREFPTCGGEPYAKLSDSERTRFREVLAALASEVDVKAKGAARFFGRVSLGHLLDEVSHYCTAQAFAEGVFNSETDGGHLYAILERGANKWRQCDWPHQLLGAGTIVQNAPYDHAEKALLLQVSGVDVLAGSCTDGMLQFWIPKDELKRAEFENVVATLECS
ncbi:MAG: DUF1963 domain-containing protein [Hyphomonadaceae bacterium]|nr:DUF1963 domain-containing protein [Hyphomonadaceae bacterium]